MTTPSSCRETLETIKTVFPGTTRIRTRQELRRRADEVLLALGSLLQVNRGKRVSRQRLLEAMREIVMDGLAWGDDVDEGPSSP